MAQPLAIFASIPSSDPENPIWDQHLGILPVVYQKPYTNWPLLDWTNNLIEEYTPLIYGEEPSFLWAHPQVLDPNVGESYTFVRKWTIGNEETLFDSRRIPSKDLIAVVSFAADDNYSIGFFIGGVEKGDLLSPIGANRVQKDSWRNVRTFVYHLNLKCAESGSEVAFVAEVTNIPLPKGISKSNPAMFTWVMQIFDYDNL